MATNDRRRNSLEQSRRGAKAQRSAHYPFLVCTTLFVVVLALLLVACGASEPQPLMLNREPWADGEVSIYRVTGRDGDPAGVMRIDINSGKLRSGERGWLIRREVKTEGDREIVAVESSLGKLLPEHVMLIRTNADGTERVETIYDNGQVDMTLTTKANNTTYQRSSTPTDARDERTILLMARMLPLAEGYSVRFNSYLPVADLLDRVTLQVLKREEVAVPAGVFDAWLVELDNGYRSTRAWIGAEPPHPLVKYEDGRSQALFELETVE